MKSNIRLKFIPALFLAFLIITVMPSMTFAGDEDPYGFATKKFVGARLGVWVNTGDEIVSNGDDKPSNASFYGEFFFSKHFWPALAIEGILGLYGRGDIEIQDGGRVYQGELSIYPILATGKLYPLASFAKFPLKPYFQVGGGLVVGSRPIFEDVGLYVDVKQKTEVSLTYTFGGGIDFPVADQIALTANCRYTSVDFKSDFDGIEDFSGWQLTFGAGYTFK